MKGLLKNIVGAVAPTIGTALGGPMGNMAMGKIAEVLGVSNDQKSIQQAIQNATPEQMLELKKAEQEPKNLEMYMLIEHLAWQIESIEKEIEASRYNKVNIDHLKEQIITIQQVIDKLRNGNH